MIKGGNNTQEMFDGMTDQFYHFLASTSTSSSSSTHPTTTTSSSSLPLPLSFSLHHHHHHHHGGAFPSYPPQPPPPPPPSSFDSPPFPLSPPPHILHHQQQLLFPFDQLHQSSHSNNNSKHQAKQEMNHHHHHVSVATSGLELEPNDHSWSNDEVLALLRIRSCVDTNWFPDFTWENVSRKLGELGFKRSAEKCKEKFEEETRSFNNNIIINNLSNKNIITNNYRLFGEFEDLYNTNNSDNHHHQQPHETLPPPPPPPPPPSDHDHENSEGNDVDMSSSTHHRKNNQSPRSGQNEEQIEDMERDKAGNEELVLSDDKVGGDEKSQSVNDSQETEENTKRQVMKKRKRQKKFEMLKGFCEGIVNKMMEQQEELHSKILQDMVKRDEEKIAKEEAWKKQENERIQKEIEIRARELAIASDRQAKLFDILDKFTSSNSLDVQSFGEALEDFVKVPNTLAQECGKYYQSTSSLVTQNCQIQIPTSSNYENVACQSSSRVENSKLALPMSSSSIDQVSKNPNIAIIEKDHTSTDTADQNTKFRYIENQSNDKLIVENKVKDDIGRRWPRDEVLALINIRCNLLNNNGDHSQHDNKGPLWERISQKMMEVGYKRSAKRCKEKWENINKYFRKTKDLNKKRSIDSRTCPYFHQLNHLYSQGTLVGTPDRSTSQPNSPEEKSTTSLPGGQGDSTSSALSGPNTTMHDSQGNNNQQRLVQAPAFDFEF